MSTIHGGLVLLNDSIIYSHSISNYPSQLLSPFDSEERANGINILKQYIDSNESIINYKDGFIKMLNFEESDNDTKWLLICKQQLKLKVCIVCSIPLNEYYYENIKTHLYLKRALSLCDNIINAIQLSFNEYDEDYDPNDDENINEMPLYILKIRCKIIFYKLLTKFNSITKTQNCWWNCCKCCKHSLDKKRDRNVLQLITSDRRKSNKIHKILIVGASNTGKSTLLRQLRILFDNGYDNEQRKMFIPLIKTQIIEQLKILIEEYQNRYQKLNKPLRFARETLENVNGQTEFNETIVSAIQCVCLNEAVKQILRDIRQTSGGDVIFESSLYFWENIQTIADANYIPSQRDILSVKITYNKVHQLTLNIENNTFQFILLPQPDTDSSKYMHQFSDVAAVIFMMSLSNYSNENSAKQLHWLELFEEIVNSRWFKQSSMFLFLNKSDLLKANITANKDSQVINAMYEETIENVNKTFINCVKDRRIYTHVTCAIDGNNIERIMYDVTHSVMRRELSCNGFMGVSKDETVIELQTTERKDIEDVETNDFVWEPPERVLRYSQVFDPIRSPQIYQLTDQITYTTDGGMPKPIPRPTPPQTDILRETIPNELLPKYARPKKPWGRQVMDYSILDSVGSGKKKAQRQRQIQPKASVEVINPYESMMKRPDRPPPVPGGPPPSFSSDRPPPPPSFSGPPPVPGGPPPVPRVKKKLTGAEMAALSSQNAAQSGAMEMTPISYTTNDLLASIRGGTVLRKSQTIKRNPMTKDNYKRSLLSSLKRGTKLSKVEVKKEKQKDETKAAIFEIMASRRMCVIEDSDSSGSSWSSDSYSYKATKRKKRAATTKIQAIERKRYDPQTGKVISKHALDIQVKQYSLAMDDAVAIDDKIELKHEDIAEPMDNVMAITDEFEDKSELKQDDEIQKIELTTEPMDDKNIPLSFERFATKTLDKTAETKNFLKKCLLKQEFFQNMNEEEIDEMVNRMYKIECPMDECIIKQNEFIVTYFIIESGSFDVIIPSTHEVPSIIVGKIENGCGFGEESLQGHSMPRATTLKASENCIVWALDVIEIDRAKERVEELRKAKESKITIRNILKKIKTKIAEWKAARQLIDNVFGDLENMFYLLSKLLLQFELESFSSGYNETEERFDKMMKVSETSVNIDQSEINIHIKKSKCEILLINLLKILLIPFVYLLIIVVTLFVILPSCFFLLIVRMNKVETDTKKLTVREKQIFSETMWQRFIRVVNQLIRSSFVFMFLVIYPICIMYIIIPYFGEGNDLAIVASISSYLISVLLLQMFGTYRSIQSFEERKKLRPNELRYQPKIFKWNIGSILAICLMIYEIFQLSIFAYQTTTDGGEQNNDNNQSEQSKFTADDIGVDSKKILNFANVTIKVCYLSLDFLESHILEYYVLFSIIFVGLLMLFFIYRFIYELKQYGRLKWKEENDKQAREIYFHSFIGTIIYGHGTLRNVNKWTAKIISLLADSLFLAICQKLILILSCDENQYLRIDPMQKCWEGKHKIYATISLIMLGYYIPICTMIAPMFAEDVQTDRELQDIEEKNERLSEETEEKRKGCLCCAKKNANDEKKQEDNEEEPSAFKQFLSFSNTISFVSPFMSVLTVTECFMLISSQFISKGNVFGTIISQSISMIVLLIFTINWSFTNLKKYGLTQNEPVFPFGISMIRNLGFFCGAIGCILEIFRLNNVIDDSLELFLLFVVGILSAIVVFIVFKRYHSFFNSLDDEIDVNIMIKFRKKEKELFLYDEMDECDHAKNETANDCH